MDTSPGSIHLTATLHRPETPRNASWTFVLLPHAASAKLPTRAMVGINGTLEGQPFKATLSPDGQGSHWLKVPRALREAAWVEVGDQVSLIIAPSAETPEPRVPADLRSALSATRAARAQWLQLTPAARRDFIQWLDTSKKPDTRTRRISTACDMLAAGKRRICCFDRSGMYSKALSAPVAADVGGRNNP